MKVLVSSVPLNQNLLVITFSFSKILNFGLFCAMVVKDETAGLWGAADYKVDLLKVNYFDSLIIMLFSFNPLNFSLLNYCVCVCFHHLIRAFSKDLHWYPSECVNSWDLLPYLCFIFAKHKQGVPATCKHLFWFFVAYVCVICPHELFMTGSPNCHLHSFVLETLADVMQIGRKVNPFLKGICFAHTETN